MNQMLRNALITMLSWFLASYNSIVCCMEEGILCMRIENFYWTKIVAFLFNSRDWCTLSRYNVRARKGHLDGLLNIIWSFYRIRNCDLKGWVNFKVILLAGSRLKKLNLLQIIFTPLSHLIAEIKGVMIFPWVVFLLNF